MAARILAAAGYRVLVGDLDPQGSISGHLGRIDEVDYGETLGAYDVMDSPDRHPIEEAIIEMEDRISLLHGDARLDNVQSSLPVVALSRALPAVADDYDFILLDCSPSWNNIIQAALLVANTVVVPAIPHVDDLETASDSFRRAREMNPGAVVKVVVNKARGRKEAGFISRADQEAIDLFGDDLGPAVCKTALPDSDLVRRYTDSGEKIGKDAGTKQAFFAQCVASVAEVFDIPRPKIKEF